MLLLSDKGGIEKPLLLGLELRLQNEALYRRPTGRSVYEKCYPSAFLVSSGKSGSRDKASEGFRMKNGSA